MMIFCVSSCKMIAAAKLISALVTSHSYMMQIGTRRKGKGRLEAQGHLGFLDQPGRPCEDLS